tara:strand:+ start:3050 stop:3310 length:261 start_codon:yes stop_codon:yes gene_type:complete
MNGLRIAHMEYWGHEAEIEYSFDPGEPEVHTESNGDPGTPGTGPSVEVERIWVELESNEGRSVVVDISSVFYETSIEEQILEKYHD